MLTTKRTNECYEAIFKYIEKYIFQMEPDEIITDFEAGLRLAINKHFPCATLRGCWYHYCVKIRQRFAIHGLKSLLKTHSIVKLVKKELMSLPLLPADKFLEGYTHIKRVVEQYGLAGKFKQFFDYYNYWISEVTPQKKIAYLNNLYI